MFHIQWLNLRNFHKGMCMPHNLSIHYQTSYQYIYLYYNKVNIYSQTKLLTSTVTRFDPTHVIQSVDDVQVIHGYEHATQSVEPSSNQLSVHLFSL
jgi:hypothetical protein